MRGVDHIRGILNLKILYFSPNNSDIEKGCLSDGPVVARARTGILIRYLLYVLRMCVNHKTTGFLMKYCIFMRTERRTSTGNNGARSMVLNTVTRDSQVRVPTSCQILQVSSIRRKKCNQYFERKIPCNIFIIAPLTADLLTGCSC